MLPLLPVLFCLCFPIVLIYLFLDFLAMNLKASYPMANLRKTWARGKGKLAAIPWEKRMKLVGPIIC